MELEKQFDSKKIEQQIKDYLSSIDLEKLIFDSPEKIKKSCSLKGHLQ